MINYQRRILTHRMTGATPLKIEEPHNDYLTRNEAA